MVVIPSMLQKFPTTFVVGVNVHAFLQAKLVENVAGAIASCSFEFGRAEFCNHKITSTSTTINISHQGLCTLAVSYLSCFSLSEVSLPIDSQGH